MSSTTAAPRRRPMTRRRLWLIRLIFLTVSVVVCLGLGEITARVLHLAPPVHPEADTAIVLHYTDPNGPIHLTPNWKGYVGYVWTEVNAKGFRDRVYTPEPPPGTVRVAVLGDSYTMGDAVTLEATYTKRAEAMLAAGHKVEVMNCGVSATNTRNQLETLKEVLRDYHPHLVVLSYNINDFQSYPVTRFDKLAKADYVCTVQPDGRVTVSRDYTLPQQVKVWVRNNSYFYRWLANVWDSWTKQKHGAAEYDHLTRVQSWVDSDGPAKSFEALEQMRDLCAKQGVSFSVIILPGLLDMPPTIPNMDEYPFKKEHATMHERMTALGIEYIDLLPDFAGQGTKELEAHPFDRHYSVKGNEIIARALQKHLEPKIKALEK